TPLPAVIAWASATERAAVTASPIMTASGSEPDGGGGGPAAAVRAGGGVPTRGGGAVGSGGDEAGLRELKRHERSFPNGKLAGQRKELLQVVAAELSARDGGRR